MPEMSSERLAEIDRRLGAGGGYTAAVTKQELRVALIELVDEVRRQRRTERTGTLERAAVEHGVTPGLHPDQPAAPEDGRPNRPESEAWPATLRPSPDEYEAESQRLRERADQAYLARIQAELRAAKLRLVLASALSNFTDERRRGHNTRSAWIDAARIELWQRVFTETAPAAWEGSTVVQHAEEGKPTMSYVRHDAVVVTTFDSPLSGSHGVTQADFDAFRDSLPDGWRQLLVGPIPSVINGYATYAFLPDGSKEGWPHSDDGDEYRRRFKELFACTFDDGSTPFDIAHVRFGGDEPGERFEPELIVDNGHGLRTDSGQPGVDKP